MKLSRTAAILALLLPATLVAQGAGQPTQAQLKARAELARQRALQQQAQQTRAPSTTPATKTAAAPQTKTATPQTKAGATAQVPTPQTKTAVPQTKTATVPVPQTKTATPQTSTATVPPPTPQMKTAAPSPAGSAIAAGQGTNPRLQPTPPAEVTFNREVFSYVKGNRRDPFTTMITSSDLRPVITDLKLVTVIRSANAAASVAIMRDLTTNEQYRVRVGQTLGRMRVAQIQQRAVVFTIEEFGYNRQEVVSMDDSTRARTP